MLIQLHIKYKKRKKSTAQAHYILVLLVKLPCIPGSIPAQILVVQELPGVVSSDLCPLVKRPTVHPVSELAGNTNHFNNKHTKWAHVARRRLLGESRSER